MKSRIGLALGLGAAFILGGVCGVLAYRNDTLRRAVRQALPGSPAPGAAAPVIPLGWSRFEAPRPEAIPPDAAEQLAALGYASGYNPAPKLEGVTIHDTALAHGGLNLVLSAHAPEATLMDMAGETLHTWRCDFGALWPDYLAPDPARDYTGQGHKHWRRARLLEDGSLIAIHNGIGILKLDKDSNLVWKRDGGFHHDLDVADGGAIYTLLAEAKVLPRVNRHTTSLEDFVVILEPDGAERARISLLECFENSVFASTLDKMPNHGDLFHTNAIQVFDGALEGRSSHFRKGNILVSVWTLNTIAIVDLDARQVVWTASGMWVKQHEPQLLPSGNMLVFDNQGFHGQSKVIEFDPFTREVAWMYHGNQNLRFYSELLGAQHRLPNGNTLIVESTQGRAFEVTPAGQVVWEYLNPHRAGPRGSLIANLFDVVRLERDEAAWLAQHGG